MTLNAPAPRRVLRLALDEGIFHAGGDGRRHGGLRDLDRLGARRAVAGDPVAEGVAHGGRGGARRIAEERVERGAIRWREVTQRDLAAALEVRAWVADTRQASEALDLKNRHRWRTAARAGLEADGLPGSVDGRERALVARE